MPHGKKSGMPPLKAASQPLKPAMSIASSMNQIIIPAGLVDVQEGVACG